MQENELPAWLLRDPDEVSTVSSRLKNFGSKDLLYVNDSMKTGKKGIILENLLTFFYFWSQFLSPIISYTIFQISQTAFAEEEEKYYGANAKRQRKDVDYSDNLTEKQWLKVRCMGFISIFIWLNKRPGSEIQCCIYLPPCIITLWCKFSFPRCFDYYHKEHLKELSAVEILI